MRIEFVPNDAKASVTRELTDSLLDHDQLLGAHPVRGPVYFKGQWSKPGWYWMASVGRPVSYESKFERSFLIQSDFAGTVTAVVPQPCRLHFERDTAPYRHVPDFLLAHRHGLPELADIKGAKAREKSLNRLVFTLTERACQQLGFSFTVYTEPDPIWQENLAFLAGYRNPHFTGLDQHLPLVVDLLAKEALPFSVLCERLTEYGLPSWMAPAVVWRAAWLRAVAAPLNARLLGIDSVIELPSIRALGDSEHERVGGAA